MVFDLKYKGRILTHYHCANHGVSGGKYHPGTIYKVGMLNEMNMHHFRRFILASN
jgi:hypothetical protein